MKFILFNTLFIISIFSFAQNSVTTKEGNLTIEWNESLKNLMAEKENKICKRTEKEETNEYCQGARVQVFYSKNRSDAEQKLKEAKYLFPAYRTSIEYFSPEYRVQVGYFKSREDAADFLQKAKIAFPLSLTVDQVVRCSLLD